MGRPSRDYVSLTLRVPADWREEADRIAKMISPGGVEMSRSDAFRAAIARGFEAIRAEHSSKKSPKK